MSEWTIATLCQILANLTHNRCHLIENSHTCRCIGDASHPTSSSDFVRPAPDIMLSEVLLIFFVLAIWLSAIGFCLHQYKSLRRLETQVHYCVDRKDPVNIGDIKIVTREQDSIIYKKKRYPTILDTRIDPQQFKTMHYVQQYLPSTIPSDLVINRDDLGNNNPMSTLNGFNSSNNISLNTRYETSIPYFKTDAEGNKRQGKVSLIQRTGSARYTTGLTVPRISPSNSLHSSWNETNSIQHLSVPSNSLGSNCYSDENISLPVSHIPPKTSGEQLLDPRLISETVRRSLLALHRESQENVNLLKKKDKTRSENDVPEAITPLKLKLKSKFKHTSRQQYRPHSNTLSILPLRTNSNDYDRRLPENVKIREENQSSTTSVLRRSLKYYPEYSTESDPTPANLPLITNISASTDNDEEVANKSA